MKTEVRNKNDEISNIYTLYTSLINSCIAGVNYVENTHVQLYIQAVETSAHMSHGE